MAKKPDTKYENNPFNIGLNGLKLFFGNAQQVAIYTVVLAFIAFILNSISTITDVIKAFNTSVAKQKADQAASNEAVREFFAQDVGRLAVSGVLIASVIFIVIVIWLLLYGVLEYTGARLALGEKVTLRQAFKAVGSDLAAYVWLYVLIFVKLLFWTLLFVVPGIIMAVRYLLAGTVFFAEGKRGNDAIIRSLELTKGAWFTTFAGFGLWNLITLNQINSVLAPGSAAVLYRQLRDVTDAGQAKPPAHWLSWLVLFVPIVLIMFLIGFLMLFAIALAVTTTAP